MKPTRLQKIMDYAYITLLITIWTYGTLLLYNLGYDAGEQNAKTHQTETWWPQIDACYQSNADVVDQLIQCKIDTYNEKHIVAKDCPIVVKEDTLER